MADSVFIRRFCSVALAGVSCFMVGCGGGSESSPSTNTSVETSNNVPATTPAPETTTTSSTMVPSGGWWVNDGSYSWSTPEFVISYELMGMPADGTTRAGVNSGGFIDGDGNLRVIFASGPGATKKASVISRDGGETFIVDNEFSWPVGAKEGLGHISVSEAPEGGFRAFLRDDVGIASAYSPDGQVWVAEDGYRVTAADLGIDRVDGGSVVRLPDGRYRMYIGDESEYFRVCGSARPVSTVIFSATSDDQINWTVDPGYRIGPEETDLCKLHPHAFVDTNGDVVVVFHVNNEVTKSTSEWMSSCFMARSEDGLTFEPLTKLEPVLPALVPGGGLSASDCDVVVMPDKTVRLFFSVSGPQPEGDQVAMAVGTPTG